MRSVLIGATIVFTAMTPAFGQSAAHPPIPRNRASWIKGDHYPTAAFRARAQGHVAFVLTIDPKGHPSACRVTETSGNADLDSTTCDLFRKNGRFDPAVDDTAKPVAGEWSGGMVWTLPR